tara:strand:- start:2480 stop:2770 length:291 start_codon:yes stop_codon:yes gene_type:complete
MSIFFNNKGEEPTAKDSLIKDYKDRFDSLHKLYKEMYSECRELLRENTGHKIRIAELEAKVEALNNVFQDWKQSNDDLKKKINPKIIYDGIQEYQN